MDIAVLKTRVITGLVFGVVVIGSIWAGKWPASALLVLISAGSTWEYLRIVLPDRLNTRLSAVALSILSAVAIIFVKTDPSWIRGMLIGQSILFILMLIHLWRPWIQHDKVWPVHTLVYTILPFLPALYCVHHVSQNTGFLLWVLILIWISDSAAYFAGSWWGKNKLFERISPKKTWEGFIGAGIFTVATGILLWKTTGELSLWQWLVMSVVIWVAGTLGDLYESSIKRTFNIKDSGNFLPGHGGFLDRFDSFIYVLPFCLLVMFFLT